jgi:restriction system protein
MARRKKTSPADALIDLVALLPWWAGMLLGVLSYLLLHRLAIHALVPSTVGLPTQAIWKGLATAGQYIVPILCFAGAGISAWRRRTRTQLVADVAQTQATSALDGMSWRERHGRVSLRARAHQVKQRQHQPARRAPSP